MLNSKAPCVPLLPFCNRSLAAAAPDAHVPKPKLKLGGSLFNNSRPAVAPPAPATVQPPSGASVHRSAGGGGELGAAVGPGHGEAEERHKDKKHKRDRHADETPEERAQRKQAKKERKNAKKVRVSRVGVKNPGLRVRLINLIPYR